MSPRAANSRAGDPRAPSAGADPWSLRAWTLRVVVIGAFLATVWLAGPRAWQVAAQRIAPTPAATGRPVALDRVRLLANPPEWLRGPLLVALLEDLEPRLRGSVAIMDDTAAGALRSGLEASPWVTEARLERRFPDRFRVEFELRRPVLEVVAGERVVALVDSLGIALPAPVLRTGLPRTVVSSAPPDVVAGAPFPDHGVRAAAGVVREWNDEIRSAVADAPLLVEVDARNLGWRFVADPAASQIVVGLERRDGGTAFFHYGLAHADGGPVEPAVKAAVLGDLVREHPGLDGITGGDLRRRNLWRHCLLPR